MKPNQQVFAHLGGQDDNLGDSALRVSYLDALRGPGRRVHVYLGEASSDYVSAFPQAPDLSYYRNRLRWREAERAARKPVHAFNAGEINPQPGIFPVPRRAAECARVLAQGGALIFAGLGLKNVEALSGVSFDESMLRASVMSWRDQGSRDAAGFGEYSPDWAFSSGTPTADWLPADRRPLVAVTMRFDRAWPGPDWFAAVRGFSESTGTRIVTLAQVARDAPRAVRLADQLGGEYLPPVSMRHLDIDTHVRSVYRESLAVISDRAHGLIIGATEGAFPLGSGSDPHKISRLLAAVGLGGLVGRYDELEEFAWRFAAHVDTLAPAIDAARADLTALTGRIHGAMEAVA